MRVEHPWHQRTLEAYQRRLARPVFMDGTPMGATMTVMNLRAVLPTALPMPAVDAFRDEVYAIVERHWEALFARNRAFVDHWQTLLREQRDNIARLAGVKHRWRR